MVGHRALDRFNHRLKLSDVFQSHSLLTLDSTILTYPANLITDQPRVILHEFPSVAGVQTRRTAKKKQNKVFSINYNMINASLCIQLIVLYIYFDRTIHNSNVWRQELIVGGYRWRNQGKSNYWDLSISKKGKD